MRLAHLALIVGVSSCMQLPGQSGETRQALAGVTIYHLTNANVLQLRSIDFEVEQKLVSGNLELALCLRHNSVWNNALGVDHFFYDAEATTFPLISVNEAGWRLNYDGTQADGFGSFASHKSANSAGRGGISCADPLVFTLQGDPTGGTNAPLELALHVRFDGDCSGWVSNRALPGMPSSDESCDRLPDCPPPPPICP